MLTQAVFLVGGKGTRLGSITAHTPKPLLMVGGKPFLLSLMDEVARYGVTQMVLLGGYRPEVLTGFVQALPARPYSIKVHIEPQQAGTAGALLDAAPLLMDEFFVFNGDSFLDVNLVELARVGHGYHATLALREVADRSRFGSVTLQGNTITEFAEKRAGPSRGLINGGCYSFKKSILSSIPGMPCSLEAEIFPQLATRGALGGYASTSFFIDIGVPDELERAQTAFPARLKRPAVFLDRDGVINRDTNYVHKAGDVAWIEGAVDAIRLVNARGYRVYVVTNQAGVAHGLYEESDVLALHRWMKRTLAGMGAHVDDFYYCPHHPEGKVALYRRACHCRKPEPGMIVRAHGAPIDWSKSFLVGDKDTDIEAARRAGIAALHFRGGNLLSSIGEFVERFDGSRDDIG